MNRIVPCVVAAWVAAVPAHASVTLAARDLGSLSIEELAELTITSVARRKTPLNTVAASVYVITNEDIRRAGVTTLPEALRLAPNLQVARINNVNYGISARGFNNAVGNKLLVLIDGRTVYTSVYSGVFWEAQEVMLEDIERIEVISGPGATLWGANAVNGVINVITRRATDSDGALVAAEYGGNESSGAARVSFDAGPGAMRVYARTRHWERTRDDPGSRDQWRRHQVGFRGDWTLGDAELTLQGGAFEGSSEHRGFFGPISLDPHSVRGHHLLGRWTQPLGAGEVRAQAYFDNIVRRELAVFQPDLDTFDLEVQHVVPAGAHRLIWGGGYRTAHDTTTPGVFSSFQPPSRTLQWANIFAQTELDVGEHVDLTLGWKVERNSYTGFENLPTARIAWTLRPAHLLWASASRAVRTPARFDRDVFFPENPPFVIAGGPDFRSEVAKVFELGYRAQPSPHASFSATLFAHHWDHLRSGSGLPLPLTLVNNIQGRVRGAEAWTTLQMTPRWRVMGGVLLQEKDLRFRPGAQEDTVGVDNDTLHNDPEFQWHLRSRTDIGRGVELDINLRRVGALTVSPVPAYTEVDIRVGWRVTPALDLSLTGRNLWNTRHEEFGTVGFRSEFERSVLARVEWRF